MTKVWACFAVRSAALCRVPISIVWIDGSGFIVTFAWMIRFKSGEMIMAQSILQSSKSFWDVNRLLIRKPPSAMFCISGESKTIIAPRFERARSSITVRRDVPGETSLMKSMKVFSFSGVIVFLGEGSIYNFIRWNETIEKFVNKSEINRVCFSKQYSDGWDCIYSHRNYKTKCTDDSDLCFVDDVREVCQLNRHDALLGEPVA